MVDRVDTGLVVQLRDNGRSWREIAEVHPPVKSASGKRVTPSVGSIRRADLKKDVQADAWPSPPGSTDL